MKSFVLVSMFLSSFAVAAPTCGHVTSITLSNSVGFVSAGKSIIKTDNPSLSFDDYMLKDVVGLAQTAMISGAQLCYENTSKDEYSPSNEVTIRK